MHYRYSQEHARIYSQLGVLATTYEVSFNEMGRLGNFQGKTALDFGTGTGRSALLLELLGAKRVIGVDHDENMIAQAKAKQHEGLEFHLTDKTIPLPDASIDIAVSAHVFVEMRTLEEMQQATKEIARVLKPNGTFILITLNPASIGREYKSYRYREQDELKNGDPITCIVKCAETPFEITDTYWTVDVYRQVLQSAGFIQIQTTLPLADEGDEWFDEKEVAPDVVFACIKNIL